MAERYQIKERGYLREGYFADLVLLDLDSPFEVTKENILYKCGWSPFEGYRFRSRIHSTLVNGQILYQNGAIIGDQVPRGRARDPLSRRTRRG